MQEYLAENKYPTEGVTIDSLRLAGKPIEAALAEGRDKINRMLEVNLSDLADCQLFSPGLLYIFIILPAMCPPHPTSLCALHSVAQCR